MEFIEFAISIPVPDEGLRGMIFDFMCIWVILGSAVTSIQVHRLHCRYWYRPPAKRPGQLKPYVFFSAYFSLVFLWPVAVYSWVNNTNV